MHKTLKPFLWMPDQMTRILIENRVLDERSAWKAFRNSSTGFINKKKVKAYVYKKYNDKCNFCGNSNKINLQIDHIKSVYQCFKEKRYRECNTLHNLQLLCKACNNKKSHK